MSRGRRESALRWLLFFCYFIVSKCLFSENCVFCICVLYFLLDLIWSVSDWLYLVGTFVFIVIRTIVTLCTFLQKENCYWILGMRMLIGMRFWIWLMIIKRLKEMRMLIRNGILNLVHDYWEIEHFWYLMDGFFFLTESMPHTIT